MIGDRKHHIPDSRHLGAIFHRDRLGEEGIKSNAQGRQWDGHHESNRNDRPDLSRFTGQQGKEDESKKADPVKDGRPENSPA